MRRKGEFMTGLQLSAGTALLCEDLLTPSTRSTKGSWKKDKRRKSLVDAEPGTVQTPRSPLLSGVARHVARNMACLSSMGSLVVR